MNLTENLVATLVAAIKATQSTGASPMVTVAYAHLKTLLRDRYSTLDLQALERRPDSRAKQDSLAEDLDDLGAAADPHCLATFALLAQILGGETAIAATIGVDLSAVKATALKIREIQSSSTGVRVRQGEFSETIEITDVQGGTADPSTQNGNGLDVAFTGVTAGGDIVIADGDVVINPPVDSYAAHIATLRNDYLTRLLRRTDTILLSHVNPQSQVAPRVSLKAVYTAQLTHSLVTTQQAGDRSTGNLGQRDQSGQERRLTALESINLHQHLVLLGAPGSGKSSFLKFVALCMAGELLHHTEANLALLAASLPPEQVAPAEPTIAPAAVRWAHGPLLPVYIALRELIAEGSFTDERVGSIEGLFTYINQELVRADQEDYAPYLRQELMQQGGLLLLDGLDEVSDEGDHRRQIRQMIEEFCDLYPKCRIVLSSRPYAYQDPSWQLPRFAEAILASFAPWQIERFVDAYYTHLMQAQGGVALNTIQQQTNALKAQIKTDSNLRELATSPLLLALMVSLFAWRGGALPDSTDELYAQGVDLLLNEWEQPKLEPTDDGSVQATALSVHEWLQAPQQAIRHALEELAFKAHAAQTSLEAAARIPERDLVDALLRAAGRDARPTRLTEYMQQRAGLLIAHGDHTYSFPHRTIQEYLAACYLTRANFPKQLANLVRNEPQRWREVLVLAGGKAARGAPFAVWALIDRLCPLPCTDPATATETDWWMALLAGRVLVTTELYHAEALDLSEAQILANIKAWLLALFNTAHLPTPDRALAGADLGILGDPRHGVGLTPTHLPDIAWLTIPAGPFLMGAPPFLCTLLTEPYRISRYPITIAQYQSFIKAGGYEDSQYWSSAGWQWRQAADRHGPDPYPTLRASPNQPQVGVCWHEAVAFCNWLTARTGDPIRLPSEAQWERAARHTDGRTYPWGDSASAAAAALPDKPDLPQKHLFATTIARHCNLRDSGIAQPSPVGLFPTGHAACGAADLAGNVWEWCATPWRHTYTHDPEAVDNSATGKERRVLRGGSWANEPHLVRCAHRHRNYPDHRGPNVGFRVVASAP